MAEPYRPLFTGQLGDKQVSIVHATHHFGANPATANTTVTVQIPTPPGTIELIRAVVYASTVASDADGTLTAQLIKREGAGDSDVPLTATISLESDGLTAKEKAAFVVNSTIAARQFADIDVLECDLVNNSAAIDTQPVDLIVVAEFALLD